MSKLRKRPLLDSFAIARHQEKLAANPDDQTAADMIDFYKTFAETKASEEQSEEWRRDNLEYDLRSTDWVAEKCANEAYAQNLYAALCNNQFMKNDVWPLLQDKKWSCSWRYAGGIVADIREQGDYMDYYCSGIRDVEYDDELNKQWDGRGYVQESVVTDEIKQDLFKLGWLVVPYDNGDEDA